MENVNTDGEQEKADFDSNKELLHSIYKICKEESISGLQIPLELYEERVLNYTKVPRHQLNEILEQKNTFSSLDLFERIIISDCFKKIYEKMEPFSFKDVFETIKDKIKVSDLTQFCREMGLLGYAHVNTQNHGQIVLENPKLTFERVLYLSKVKKMRANKQKTVYYLDERVIDSSLSFKKPWLQDGDMTKTDGYVFMHIVSKNGFEKGLFCNQTNAEDLCKWISDIVLPSLLPSSVIIMDKNPLHGKIVHEPITRYHSKEEMIKRLQDYNIPCTSDMRKAQLYDLIARCPFKDTKFNLDLIFKSHGHEVLRLPDNYHDLSLTELLWEHVGMHSFTETETETLLNLKTKVYSIVTNTPYEKWSQFENTIDSTEKRLFEIDEAVEEALSPYKIKA